MAGPVAALAIEAGGRIRVVSAPHLITAIVVAGPRRAGTALAVQY